MLRKAKVVFKFNSPRPVSWFVLVGVFALASLSWIFMLPTLKQNLAAVAITKCLLKANSLSNSACVTEIPASGDSGLLGVWAYYQGDYPSALRFLERAHQEHKSDPIITYWLASVFYQTGDRTSAVVYWQKTERDIMAAHFSKKAENALQEGAISQAIDHASLAVEISPSLGEGYFQLGNALREAGDERGALQAYQAAVVRELVPTQKGFAYHRIGLIYQSQEQDRKALEAFTHAAALLPASYFVHLDLAEQYQRLERYAEAEYELGKLLTTNSNDASLLTRMGNLKSEQNQFEEAERWYKLAIMADPESGIGEYGFGRLYLRLGRLDEAADNFKKSIELDPDKPWVWLALGSTCWQQGQIDEAIQAYSWVAEHAGQNQFRTQALISLAKLYTQAGDIWAADSAWNSVLEIEPGNEEALEALNQP